VGHLPVLLSLSAATIASFMIQGNFLPYRNVLLLCCQGVDGCFYGAAGALAWDEIWGA
jgi:hypothetical protein